MESSGLQAPGRKSSNELGVGSQDVFWERSRSLCLSFLSSVSSRPSKGSRDDLEGLPAPTHSLCTGDTGFCHPLNGSYQCPLRAFAPARGGHPSPFSSRPALAAQVQEAIHLCLQSKEGSFCPRVLVATKTAQCVVMGIRPSSLLSCKLSGLCPPPAWAPFPNTVPTVLHTH